jgi:hypothetical protein
MIAVGRRAGVNVADRAHHKGIAEAAALVATIAAAVVPRQAGVMENQVALVVSGTNVIFARPASKSRRHRARRS